MHDLLVTNGGTLLWLREVDVEQSECAPQASIRAACDAAEFERAASEALEVWGAEVHSFLVARMRSVSDADEVFSMFCEDLWRGLPSFSHRCPVRPWLYILARHAAHRYKLAPQNKARNHFPLEAQPWANQETDRARSATDLYRRTETKERVRGLRHQLAPEDQTLLILHVDRNLGWRELAMVMHAEGEHLPDAELEREMARLRKRFERIKRELRTLAIEAGLLPQR
jgi:RNA polymerase sigma-70 factor (ECF subfamily)